MQHTVSLRSSSCYGLLLLQCWVLDSAVMLYFRALEALWFWFWRGAMSACCQCCSICLLDDFGSALCALSSSKLMYLQLVSLWGSTPHIVHCDAAVQVYCSPS
jgi:hypothetical protein